MENRVRLIIEVSKEDAERLIEEFGDQTTKEIGDRGKKATEAGRLGFFALGNAVEDSARSMGVAGQASRQLGNSVERVASSVLPRFGTAIGVAVLAVGSIVQIISQFTAEARRQREETLKNADAMFDLASKYDMLTQSGRALTKAQDELWNAERKMKLLDLNVAIQGQNALVADLTAKYKDAWKSSNYVAARDEAEKIKAQLGVAVEKAQALVALRNLLQRPPSEETVYSRDETQQLMDEMEARNNEYNMRILMADKSRIDQQIAMERAGLQLRLSYQQAAIQTMSNAVNAYIAITGKQTLALFLISKGLAIAQIWVDTARAAMSAAAAAAVLGPQAAAAAAAEMWTLGKINMAIAAAAAIGQAASGTWAGGGAGGGGAQPVYNVNPVSGQPSPAGYYSYEQSQYGSGWRPEVDVRITLDNDMLRASVVQAVNKDIRQRGETYDTVRSYAVKKYA